MRAHSEDSILNFPDLYDAIPGILFTVPSNVPPPEHHNRPQQPQDPPPVLFTPFYSHQNKINKCEDNHPTLYMYGPGVCREVHHGRTCGQRRSSLTICGAGARQPRPSEAFTPRLRRLLVAAVLSVGPPCSMATMAMVMGDGPNGLPFRPSGPGHIRIAPVPSRTAVGTVGRHQGG